MMVRGYGVEAWCDGTWVVMRGKNRLAHFTLVGPGSQDSLANGLPIRVRDIVSIDLQRPSGTSNGVLKISTQTQTFQLHFLRRHAEEFAAFRKTIRAAMPVGRFAVVDVETTGLSPAHDRIVEFAVVIVNTHGSVLGQWSTRFNPRGPVGATHIHGISDQDVADAPFFESLATGILPWLQGTVLVAHNAEFDLAFIGREFVRAGFDLPASIPQLCTLQTAQRVYPNLDRYRLVDCCRKVGVQLVGQHSALGDARATAGLLQRLLRSEVGTQLVQLTKGAGSVSWPTAPARDPEPVPAQTTKRWPYQSPKKPSATLAQLVTRFSLLDALEEGATEAMLPYLELLAEVFEDSEVSPTEADAMIDLATAQQLTPTDVSRAHRAFVRALAHEALDDGRVSRAEKAELLNVAGLLNVAENEVVEISKAAEAARTARLSAGLLPLPDGWRYGEPLRVGDRVVFTGCDPTIRAELETRSTTLGVRVLGYVSRRTAVLVSDQSYDGTKAAKATELGTRVVHPRDYATLLNHLQPAL